MALPIVVTYTLAAANGSLLVNQASAIATGASFTLATTVLDLVQRRVQFSAAANESGNTFTVVGTNHAGFTITDSVTGPNAGTTQSNLDFRTVTKITALNQTGGSVTIGTDTQGSSLWNIVNWHVSPSNIAFACVLVSGAATFSIQYTYDDPNNLPAGVGFPQPFNQPSIVNATATVDGASNDPITAWRLFMAAGTGTVRATGIQAGIGGP